VTSRVAGALAWIGLSGCSEPDWVPVIGAVNLGAERTITLSAPARVTAATRFIVTFSTFGSSNCTRADRTELTTTGNLARLVPYDEEPEPGSGVSCFRDAAQFVHSHAVEFDAPGAGTLRVVGYFDDGMSPAELDSVDVVVPVDP
jgi:hypothetical protein